MHRQVHCLQSSGTGDGQGDKTQRDSYDPWRRGRFRARPADDSFRPTSLSAQAIAVLCSGPRGS